MSKCEVCFRHCDIPEGGVGFCMARSCKDGSVYPISYGKVTSLALDPIEKKPLRHFHGGSKILSVGSYGCNLRCPFCQNSEISWAENVPEWEKRADTLMPDELADIAQNLRDKGNIGVAFTYNEPLICYEYILDTAKLIHEKGMVNVLVSNGTAELPILEKLIPYIDAMNIDLKGFHDGFYENVLKGDKETVLDFIKEASDHCHIELTTLIVTGENDSDDEMLKISSWIADIDPNIPLHISRFFPCFHMTDRPATDVGRIYHLADIASERLRYVHTGNV